ncbi:hypothetical protein AWB74_08562 [Caballeronia arvi]|uniref:HicB family protein n=1 Tax=Caballeronia arvi TaxID=1777135 RepID=A0A158L4W9_9BURK|nr:hypothetical protein [Caballeronia arvi]SAL88437.1 hypothetical protein AWB74_08562 [Caballeronia arvi]
MSQSFEIKLERQSGGWVWAAFLSSPEDGTTFMVGQCSEAFATEEMARHDAERLLNDLYGGSMADGQEA